MTFALSSTLALATFISFALLALSHGSGINCEDLPKESCAFAISGSAKRCVLEKYQLQYQCSSSEVVVGTMRDYVESEQCINACGVDRSSVGISSDSLLEPGFIQKLCSRQCYQNCPNIVDLYFNLAAGEGVFLPDLCQARRSGTRRAMIELMSAGVTMGPTADVKAGQLDALSAPAPAPMSN